MSNVLRIKVNQSLVEFFSKNNSINTKEFTVIGKAAAALNGCDDSLFNEKDLSINLFSVGNSDLLSSNLKEVLLDNGKVFYQKTLCNKNIPIKMYWSEKQVLHSRIKHSTDALSKYLLCDYDNVEKSIFYGEKTNSFSFSTYVGDDEKLIVKNIRYSKLDDVFKQYMWYGRNSDILFAEKLPSEIYRLEINRQRLITEMKINMMLINNKSKKCFSNNELFEPRNKHQLNLLLQHDVMESITFAQSNSPATYL